MTLHDLLAQAEERATALTAERKNHDDELRAMRAAVEAGDASVTADQIKNTAARRATVDIDLAEANADVERLRAEIAAEDEVVRAAQETAVVAETPKYDEVARTQSEPRTYTAETSRQGTSFFKDAQAFQLGGDYSARDRIERHMREVAVEGEMSVRSNTSASAGGLVVPQYLTDLAALALRSGRPFANLVNQAPLPDQGMAFFIPRFTTGSATAVQATQNTAVQNTPFAVTDLQVDVRTIAGEIQPSRQLLERGTPGIDELIYLDLASAYHANLDSQCITGSGASGQILGIQNVPGISTATAFGAAPTITTFNSKVAGAVNAVAAAGTAVQPRAILMSPRRWAWLLSLSDTTNRPVVVPTIQGPWNGQGVNLNPGAYSADGTAVSTSDVTPVGYFQGLPVFTDSNVPQAVGTPSEDLVFVLDTRQLYLWEDNGGMPSMLRFDQTTGNALQVRLVVYGYAAFAGGRYPAAISRVGGADGTIGQGLIAPTF